MSTALMDPQLWMDGALTASLVFLAAALVMTVLRLFKGPGLCDRVIALDLIATLLIGVAVVTMIKTGRSDLFGVVSVFAVLSFLGTVAFSYYIDKRGSGR